MTTITLAKVGKHQTITFAVNELARYLKMMDASLLIDQRTYDEYDSSLTNVIWLGLTPMVNCDKLNDAIVIDVKDGVGVITGANERAVLIAAYRFLRELGCRWIRPGNDGEVIPTRKLDRAALCASIHETPSTRYRSVCSEGATVYEHFYNMIDWLPKVGMNAYLMQFFAPLGNFNLWYGHKYNPFKEAERRLSFDEVLASKNRIDEEAMKRSLIYIGVGHCFTTRPFGISDSYVRDINDPRLSESYKKLFAQINGERGLFQNRLNFTQLCYSKKEVRDTITDFAVEYCKNTPVLNVLSFTLADGMNNYCECEECSKYSASEWYVTILNEMDEKFTAAGLDTKILASLYVDLLWAPEKVKLNNPDRFILEFCPSSRTYSRPLYDMKCDSDSIELPPYERNKLILPRDVESLVAHYNSWRKVAPECKSVLFDYQMMWDHYLDPGYASCAKMLHLDMTGLEKLGLEGYISCQEHRAAFPTGLPVYTMAAGLWDKDSKFEDISRDYYAAAFGEDGPAVEAYLAKISELFDPAFMRNDHVEAHRDVIERMDAIDALVNVFETSHIAPNREKNASWKYLSYHSTYCKLYAELVRTYAHGDAAKIEAQTKALTAYHFSLEEETHTVLDNFYFDEVYQRWIKRVFSNKPTTEVDF